METLEVTEVEWEEVSAADTEDMVVTMEVTADTEDTMVATEDMMVDTEATVVMAATVATEDGRMTTDSHYR